MPVVRQFWATASTNAAIEFVAGAGEVRPAYCRRENYRLMCSRQDLSGGAEGRHTTFCVPGGFQKLEKKKI